MKEQPACYEEVAMGCMQCIMSSYEGGEEDMYIEVR